MIESHGVVLLKKKQVTRPALNVIPRAPGRIAIGLMVYYLYIQSTLLPIIFVYQNINI